MDDKFQKCLRASSYVSFFKWMDCSFSNYIFASEIYGFILDYLAFLIIFMAGEVIRSYLNSVSLRDSVGKSSSFKIGNSEDYLLCSSFTLISCRASFSFTSLAYISSLTFFASRMFISFMISVGVCYFNCFKLCTIDVLMSTDENLNLSSFFNLLLLWEENIEFFLSLLFKVSK